MTKTKEPEKGMGDRIIEVLERPQSPSEAALFHEIETLKRTVTFLFDKSNVLAQRLDDLEAQKRPGDD